jgi:hypothetical protein
MSSHLSTATSKPSTRRSKLRTKGGLVQGTGRLRPNGTIKRSDSKPVQPPVPVKYKTVIDQAPVPLYCSDDCRRADLENQHQGRPVDPQRVQAKPLALTESMDSDTSSSTSDDSSSSSSTTSQQDLSHLDPSIVRMAEIYNFPFLPPPLPAYEEDRDYSVYYGEYTSGVMMASKRIRDFCPKPKKHTGNYPPPPEPKRHIPGWTDGTQGWRDSVYSMRATKASEDPSRYNSPPKPPAPRRSNSSSSSVMPHYGPKILSNEEMLSNYSASFRRPGAHTPSVGSPPSPSSSRSTSSSRRERSLVHPKAEGKLLVPDVKMKVSCRSSSSLSTLSSPSLRPGIRSPLSMSLEDKPKRPSAESTCFPSLLTWLLLIILQLAHGHMTMSRHTTSCLSSAP